MRSCIYFLPRGLSTFIIVVTIYSLAWFLASQQHPQQLQQQTQQQLQQQRIHWFVCWVALRYCIR